MVLVELGEIAWIEAADYYACLHTDAGALMMRESLKSLEERLDGRRFVRIHRSAIVNLDRVRELKPSFGGEYFVILRDGTRLKLARSRRAGLEALLESGL
ncbi:MAG: LytTR family DNA-binding domain-containing protein [Acidobacteriota bacterium]